MTDEDDENYGQVETEVMGHAASLSHLNTPNGGRNDSFFGGVRDSSAFISMSIDANDGAGI